MSSNSTDGDVLLAQILAILQAELRPKVENEDSIASTTNLIALSALVVAVVAFVVTFLQAILDYTRSNETARLRCNSAAIGLASGKTVKRWSFRSWRRKYYYPQLRFDSDSLISAIHPPSSFHGLGLSSFRRLFLGAPVSSAADPSKNKRRDTPRFPFYVIWTVLMMIVLEIGSVVNKSIWAVTQFLKPEPLVDRPRATWAQSLEVLQVRNIDNMMKSARINADSLPTAIDVPVQYINMYDLGVLSFLLGCRWVQIDRNTLKFSAAGPRIVVTTEELPAFGKVVRFQHTVAQTNTENWDYLVRLENPIKANLELSRFWNHHQERLEFQDNGPTIQKVPLIPGSAAGQRYMHQTVDLLLGKIQCGGNRFPADDLSFFEVDPQIRREWCIVPELEALLERRDLHSESNKMTRIVSEANQGVNFWACFTQWKNEASRTNSLSSRGSLLGFEPVIMTIGCYASIPRHTCGSPSSVIVLPFLEFYYKLYVTTRHRLKAAVELNRTPQHYLDHDKIRWNCDIGWAGPGVPYTYHQSSDVLPPYEATSYHMYGILKEFEPFEETHGPIQTVRLNSGITSSYVVDLLGHTDGLVQLLACRLEMEKGIDDSLIRWTRGQFVEKLERERRPGLPTQTFRLPFAINKIIIAAIAESNEPDKQQEEGTDPKCKHEGDAEEPLGRLQGKLLAAIAPTDGWPSTEERRQLVVLLSDVLKLRSCLFGIFLLTLPDSSALLHPDNKDIILPMV